MIFNDTEIVDEMILDHRVYKREGVRGDRMNYINFKANCKMIEKLFFLLLKKEA
jgi:hypothetical protein